MPQRKSNMELLRIVSMFLIIFHHCAVHSGFPTPPLNTNMSYNMLTVEVGYFTGKLGVNLFILTTGYFQVNNRFKWGKLVSLLAQILFYSVLTHSIGFFVGTVSVSAHEILSLLFPTIFRQYWFATAYTIVYLFSPYSNRLIASMNEKTFRRFLITALILYSVILTVFGLINSNAEECLYYNDMIWLFIMYFTGAYIRLYSLPLLFKSMKHALLCALGTFALMTLSILVIYECNLLFGTPPALTYFAAPHRTPMFILSVAMFCTFLQLEIPYSSWINRIASTTFGIYLLHDSRGLRPWIWKTLLHFPEKLEVPTLIPQILAACAAVFLTGMVVDFARQALERVTLKKCLSSERFLRLEARFDVNNMEKES